MDKLALNLPGLKGDTNIPNPPGLRFTGPEQTSLGFLVSEFFNLFFYVAIFLAFIWFVWGAYEYMMAQGQKEALNAAKERIRYALVGFILLIVAFLIGNWAPTIFPFVRTFYEGEVPQIQNGSQDNSNNRFTQPQCPAGQTEC